MQVYNLNKSANDLIDEQGGEVICDNCGKTPIYGCYGEQEVYLCKSCAVAFTKRNLTLDQVIEKRKLNRMRIEAK